jgi:hypothetical protein
LLGCELARGIYFPRLQLLSRRATVMPQDLVVIASFGTLPEADLARAQLRDAGIVTCLENGDLVSTYWAYAVAVGGVKLLVPDADVEAAFRLLAPLATDPTSPSVHCPQCGIELPSDSAACWRCAKGEGVDEQATSDRETKFDRTWVAAIVCLIGCLLVTAFGPYGLVAFLVFAVVVHPMFVGAPAGIDTVDAPVDDDSADSWPSARVQLAESVARRAWRGAVLGVFLWPAFAVPSVLNLYSLWLLFRLRRTWRLLGRGAKHRCRIAFCFNLVALPVTGVSILAIGYLAILGGGQLAYAVEEFTRSLRSLIFCGYPTR